jgi:hypothetical protein
MAPGDAAPKGATPGFGDYVSAAFNHRVKVPGLGGLPLNWLYLAAVAGVSVAAWPLALVGAAGEVGYLAYLASHPRFRRIVQAQWQARRGEESDSRLESLSASLSPDSRARYQSLQAKCDDVLRIARRMGQADSADLDTYTTNLREMSNTYARMLALLDMFASYRKDWDKTDPAPQIAATEEELKKADLPEAIRASRQATLDILNRRAESRKEITERASVIASEAGRLEQQVALLRDQTLLTKDLSVLSQNMDLAAGMLEEHTSWLRENAGLLEGLGQA